MFQYGFCEYKNSIHIKANDKNRLQIGIVAIIMPELWIKNEF
ncbi:hypothetical protein NEILACOT_03106 [Neisseria lactamica ATCC 23970]|uniref:Uncharacterized protein n=1 Tax=Neisseria lactamica ATCC 23970 TaxID=546265 RepID=D0W6G8_NEILA|nr:hypothetical protein NEILACOT_03106 [Neisseria lactamica ATCC 23970]